MRLAQLYILGTLFIAAACSGKVNNYYLNASGGSNSAAGAVATGGAIATGGLTGSAGMSTKNGGTGGAPGYCVNPPCNIDGAGGSVGPINPNYKGGITPATPDIIAVIESAACAGWTAEIELLPALLEFVVDDSGSMLDTAAGTGTKSKWDVTRDALAMAINGDPTTGTTGMPNSTAVGMLFFPNKLFVPNMTNSTDPMYVDTPKDVSICVDVNNPNSMIPVQPLGAPNSTQRIALARGLASVAPAGGTPTDDAYIYAFQNGLIPFTQSVGGYARFMVLITDGQPTMSFQCIGTGATANPVDPQPILDHITQFWREHATKTFVIGSPGSEVVVTNPRTGITVNGRAWLSDAASAGQTPVSPGCTDTGPSYCHFDMTTSTDFTQALTDALRTIIQTAIPCSYSIPPPNNGQQIDTNYLNVIYNAAVVAGQPTAQYLVGESNPTDPSCLDGTNDGWYVDTSNNQIVLCPKTCNTVQSDKTATLGIRGGCAPYIIPPT